MQYKNITKIIIDKRKLDVLVRLGCPDNQILELIKTGTFTKTGDSLIDETLECLIDLRQFQNWGGKRKGSGRRKNHLENQVENHLENQVENHLENQVENQDANQDMFQVVDKDKDNINIIINKLKNILVNYHKRDFSTRNWRDSVDKMLRIDKIPFDDVIKCLDWYEKHIGEDFVPVIASGSSLREKYVKLENAVKRDLPKDNIQNFVPDAKREQESRLARMAELAKIESMKRVQQKYGA